MASPFQWEIISEYAPLFVEGTWMTIKAAVLCVIAGTRCRSMARPTPESLSAAPLGAALCRPLKTSVNGSLAKQ